MDEQHAPGSHERHVDEPLDDSAEGWDQRYAGADQHWSGQPNGALVAELEGATPGTVLDLGCGEGADAVWLARNGWRVTAVDISLVAVERARRAAADAGVEVEWAVGDVLVDPPAAGAYDLVSAQYPALRKTSDGTAVRVILDAVAPGGTLLFVHHADVDAMREHAHEHGFDPAAYVQPPDVAAALGDGWTIEVDEVRRRVRPEGSPGPDVPDHVLRARRR